jgi:hypothetical protein
VPYSGSSKAGSTAAAGKFVGSPHFAESFTRHFLPVKDSFDDATSGVRDAVHAVQLAMRAKGSPAAMVRQAQSDTTLFLAGSQRLCREIESELLGSSALSAPASASGAAAGSAAAGAGSSSASARERLFLVEQAVDEGWSAKRREKLLLMNAHTS